MEYEEPEVHERDRNEGPIPEPARFERGHSGELHHGGRVSPPRRPQQVQFENPHRYRRQHLRGRTQVREREHTTIDDVRIRAGDRGPPDDGGRPVIVNVSPLPHHRRHRAHHHLDHHHHLSSHNSS